MIEQITDNHKNQDVFDEVLLGSEIFIELSNDIRTTIMMILNEGKHAAAEITKRLELPPQEIHRQLSRLFEIKLVDKDSDGKYYLTHFGKITIINIPFFLFMQKHKKYFTNHVMSDLPSDFTLRLGSLNNSDLIKGVGNILEKINSIINDNTKVLRIMLPQIIVDVNKNMLSKATKGMRVFYLYGKNTLVPKSNGKIEKQFHLKKLISNDIVHRRMINHVSCAVLVTDTDAMVFFPDFGDNADMNYAFYSNDHLFRQWCLDYFKFQWTNGDQID